MWADHDSALAILMRNHPDKATSPGAFTLTVTVTALAPVSVTIPVRVEWMDEHD